MFLQGDIDDHLMIRANDVMYQSKNTDTDTDTRSYYRNESNRRALQNKLGIYSEFIKFPLVVKLIFGL